MLKLLCLAVAVTCGAAWSQKNGSHDPEATRQLHELFNETYEDFLRNFPEIATFRGRHEYDDRWSDASEESVDQYYKHKSEYLRRVRLAMKGNISEADRLSARILEYQLVSDIETRWSDLYLSRLTPLAGFHNLVYLTVDAMPRNHQQDFEKVIARLNALPLYVEQSIGFFKRGIARGFVQPQAVLDRVLAQLTIQSNQTAEQSGLLAPFRQFPESVPEAERTRLRTAARRAYETKVQPAWKKLEAFFDQTYRASARKQIALSSVPDGKNEYAARVRAMTTTDLTPERIHDLGKQEVERIEREMTAIARAAGFAGTLSEYEQKLMAAPEQRFRSKDEMLAYCRNVAKIVEPELPRLFKHIPRLLYGIRAIPEDREASTASNALFPAPDGSRPGWFNLNTYQPEKQVRFDKEALVLHEAVPGHIFQGSVALEMRIPEFRKVSHMPAYGEGWALYVESLGSELGVYRDPSSRFGQLDSERFRAARLVVDTGIHNLGWTRDQAIAYFREHAPTESVSEIDRYISWPAQALAYKVGQLKIKELRGRAEKELGPKFDVRDFHDVVLRNGAVPLQILEEEVDAYIRSNRT